MDSLNRRYIFVVALVVSCIFLRNLSAEITPERNEIGGIARAIQAYQTLHNGKLPTSWTDLREVYDLDEVNKSLGHRQSNPIEDHYQFVTKSMQFRAASGILEEGSQVLLIRTVPLEDSREVDPSKRDRWRYMIVRLKDGNIGSTRSPEKSVQRMLKESGVVITAKAELPAVEDDRLIIQENRQRPIASTPGTRTTTPQSSVAETPRPTAASSSSFPILAVAILGALILTAAVFLIRRRSGGSNAR